MALSDIKDPQAIIDAIKEYDELGRDKFLALYGYKKAKAYFLEFNGSYYDSKALAGVAHKYNGPNTLPLKPNQFSGGESTVTKLLTGLGFNVVKKTEIQDENLFPLQSYSWIAISPIRFVKVTDRSSFLHNGTGIPQGLKGFFGINDLAPNRKIEVSLNYFDEEYKAHFEMTKGKRTRLLWGSDFSDVLKARFQEWHKAFSHNTAIKGEPPKIVFEKSENGETHELKVSLTLDSLLGLKDKMYWTETGPQREWSKSENKAIVADYMDMLEKEIKGSEYSKTEHRVILMQKLENRSKGAVEFKHQNISAVLVKLDLPYIEGYKPRFNIQADLTEVVEEHLTDSDQLWNLLTQVSGKDAPSIQYLDFSDVISQPPEKSQKNISSDANGKGFRGRKIDYAKRESENRSLGLKGEEFVLEYEKKRLVDAGRIDLAEKIKHVSKEQGDGVGHDILSYTETGEEMFIEVKTTRENKYLPFFMSLSERYFLEKNVQKYYLYRVFHFDKKRQLFKLSGRELLECQFEPNQYKVRV